MKILYLGTVCNSTEYELLQKQCRVKASAAPQVFETALMKGLSENDVQLDIISYPSIPFFPKSDIIFCGGKNGAPVFDFECYWLKTINLPVIKQLVRRWDGIKKIKKWARENTGDGLILLYSIPPFLIKDIVKVAEKFSIKTVAIIPDLLENMYMNHRGGRLKNLMQDRYLKTALKYQGELDGYVYLTEAMSSVVAPGKPYIVVEGIAGVTDGIPQSTRKSELKSIMYAGRLHIQYGIMNLVEAFEQMDDKSCELWLFGDGDAESEIKNKSENNHRIRYFGRASRTEVLDYEKKASLLVNPRNPEDSYTKYSFPSKTLEYMCSGTPLLTTRMAGIPEEYFSYMFYSDDNSVEALKNKLNQIMKLSCEQLETLGKKAREFVIEQKNEATQSKRIILFINDLVG